MARLALTGAGILLLLVFTMTLSAEAKQGKLLKRKKREWILPPAKLMENTDYTNKEYIAKIRSDYDVQRPVEYYLSGPGADKPPFNLFVVDHHTGFIRVTGTLDREKQPSYNLTGIAKFLDGSLAEESIPLVVTVLDQNDNPPYFELHTGNVSESSKKGTFVMQIEGKDNDQPGTINTELVYKIISQEPPGPANMFTIDEKTGKLYVNEPTLDRETHDFYKLVVTGSDMAGGPGALTGTGTVEIKILDINDNIPTLEKSEYDGSVDENVADVIVMRIKALDKDLENTNNWLTVFTIAKGNEDGLFSIETDKETNEGILKLIKAVDFEEVQNLELGLIIENVAPFVEGEAIEMDVDVQIGEGGPRPSGAGAGAGAGVGVGVDVGVDVDADVEVDVGVNAGVDAGVDAGVNAGVDAGVDIGVDAGVDVGVDAGVDVGVDAGLKPDVGLGPGVKPGGKPGPGIKPGGKPGPGIKPGVKPGQKPAPGTKPKAPGKSYPIKIAVNNVPEGPKFIPDTKEVPVSEDPKEAPEDGVITVFAALDPDTGKPAEDVSYVKAYDPDNWFTIDEDTAEIKLNKVPDRESPFLVNGTYIAKILALTKDLPSKTATGTIAIKVLDSNDHCPTLTTSYTKLCSDKKTVFVTGHDEDVGINGAPFAFRIIPDGTRGSWAVEVINETSAALHSQESLWPGAYDLQVEVLDAQGLSCPGNEVFTVDVCTCVDTEDCNVMAARQTVTSTELSAPGIGLLLMAMCLLLFIPLFLLFCQCGGADTIFPDKFSDLPFDAKEYLIAYNTEGKGEDKEVPLQSVPIMLGNQKKVETLPVQNISNIISKTSTHQTSTVYNETVQKTLETNQSVMGFDNTYESLSHGMGMMQLIRPSFGAQHQSTNLYEDMSLPDAFLSDYYSQKAVCHVPVKDGRLEYAFEGQSSSAGSVGCCSLLESDDDLQFLNDLGPKFKLLAEICSPPTPKPSLTHKVEGTVQTTVARTKPVVKPKFEQIVETKHADVKTEKVISSTNISKTSISSVRTEPPSVTLPHSKVTNISHSTDINKSATLSRPVQTVVLQQQPIYYTTSPVLQPMHYVVQPQSQNTVLLADGMHGGSFPGLYVVSGSQSPPTGLTISGPQGSPSGIVIQGIDSQMLTNTASPTSPVSPTLLLPGSPGTSQGSVPMEGLKIIVPNPDGNYILVQERSGPGEAGGVDPGSSRGTLSRDAILVKEAASPQGVLGPAAQGSVYGILPGHTLFEKSSVAVNRNVGQTWGGKSGQMASGTVSVLGVQQPRMGMVNTVAVNPVGTLAGMGMGTLGIRQSTVDQFRESPSLEKTRVSSGALNDNINVVNTFTIPETTKTQRVSNKVSMMNSNDPGQKIPNDKAEVMQSEDIITFRLEQDTRVHPGEMVQHEAKENDRFQVYSRQTSEKSLIVKLEEPIVKSLAGEDVLHKSFEHSDTLAEKPGGATNKTVSNQSKIIDVPTNKFTNVTSLIMAISDQESLYDDPPPQSDQQESQLHAEETSGTETFLPGFDGMETISVLDDQIHDITEEGIQVEISVDRHAVPLKELEEERKPIQLSIVDGPGDRTQPDPQPDEITEQSENSMKEIVSPKESVVIDLETNQFVTSSDCILEEENLMEMNMDRQEAGPLKEEEDVERKPTQLSIVDNQDKTSEIASVPQPDEITEEQSDMDQVDKVSPEKKMVPDLKTDQVVTSSDSILAEDNLMEMSVDRQEAGPLKEEEAERKSIQLSTVDGQEDNTSATGSEPQLEETTEDQSDMDQVDNVSPEKKMVPDLKTDQVGTSSDSILAEDNLMEMSVERQEAGPLKDEEEEAERKPIQLSTVGGQEDNTSATGSEPQLEEITEEQSEMDQVDIVSPEEKVVPDLETNNIVTSSDFILPEHNLVEMSVDRKEAGPLKEEEEAERKPIQLSTVDGQEDNTSEIESVPQLDEITEDQSEMDQVDNVSPEEKVVPDLETNNIVTTSDFILPEHNLVEMSVDRQEAGPLKEEEEEAERKPIQLNIVDGQEDKTSEIGSGPQPDEITEEQSEMDQVDNVRLAEKLVSDLEINQVVTSSDCILAEENLAEMTVTSDAHEVLLVSKLKGNTDELSVTPSEPVIAPSENIVKESFPDQNAMSELKANHSEWDNHAITDVEETSLYDVMAIVENEVLQQSFSISDDQEEDSDRLDALSAYSQMEEKFISDDNSSDGEKIEDSIEQMTSQLQRYLSYSDDQDAESTKQDTATMKTEVDNVLTSDNNINVSEEEAEVEEAISAVQQNATIIDDLDEDNARKGASGRSTLLKHQLIIDENINSGDEHKHLVEEETSSIEPHFSIPYDYDKQIEKDDEPRLTFQMVDQCISKNNMNDGGKEENVVKEEASSRQQMTSISDEIEVSKSEDVWHTVSLSTLSTQQRTWISGNQDEEEEDIKSYQLLEKDCQFSENECLSEEDPQHVQGKMIHSEHKTDINQTEYGDDKDLTLQARKAEDNFDIEIKEGLDHSTTNASGQVKTASLLLETNPDSSETGPTRFIAACEVVEGAGYLVKDESMQITCEAVGVSTNTVGQASSVEESDYMHRAEPCQGQASPVQLQPDISQISRNKSRKSKNGSSKSPKSPSGKCKQQ